MKYTKPTLRSIDSESELYCGNGSGAASSGCTVGGEISVFCSFGSGDSEGCASGGMAYACLIGNLAEEAYSRCFDGTGPS